MKIADLRRAGGLVSVLGVLALPASGEASERDGLSGRAWSGIEYNSNVAVLEVDQTSGEGDFAGVFEGELVYRKTLAGGLGAEVSYDFSQSLQFDFPDFNIRTQIAMGDLSHQTGARRVGVNYFFADAALAGEGFLDIHQGTVYGETMVGNRGYLRGSYAYADKSYDIDPERDGETHAGSLNGFYFFNQAKSYSTLIYTFTDENTRDAQFSYTGHEVRARLVHKAVLARRELKLEAGASWEDRGYDGVTPSIQEVREDERLRFQLAAEQAVTRHVSVRIDYEHSILESNLPAVDFREDVVALKLGYGF